MPSVTEVRFSSDAAALVLTQIQTQSKIKERRRERQTLQDFEEHLIIFYMTCQLWTNLSKLIFRSLTHMGTGQRQYFQSSDNIWNN